MRVMSKDQEFVAEFIEIYKFSPCLWNKLDPHYHNANKREAAYTLMLEKYQEYDKKATKAMVKSKINSLRTTYSKEVRKVRDSERSGATSDELYKPTLWYYELLSFIKDQQSNRSIVNTINCDFEDEKEPEDSQSIMDNDRLDGEYTTVQGLPYQSADHEFTRQGSKRPVCYNKDKDTVSKKKVLQLVAERLKKTDNIKVGKHDSFGKYVAEELNNMQSEMVPYVKKIINLAIFEGHMKTLNGSSSIVTEQVSEQFSTFQPPQSYFATAEPRTISP